MFVAESYVYQNPDGSGYVGRSPQAGGAKIIAYRGDQLADEVVAALGLEDLADHTDYSKAEANWQKQYSLPKSAGA